MVYPWYTNPRFFREWWYVRWFDIPVPGYRRPFAAGPLILVWVGLSILGAVLFFKGSRGTDDTK